MKKRVVILSLLTSLIIGSLLTMLSSNMLFCDVANVSSNMEHSTLLVTFTAAAPTIVVMLSVLFVIRLYKNPNILKAHSKTYLIATAIIGGVGAITALLCGLLVYKSFVKPYPFTGFTIIFLILNVFICCGSICGLLLIKKLPDGEIPGKKKFINVLGDIGWFLFIAFVFNRFGSFITSPAFIYWRNFNLTFPFYLYLLLPLCVGVIRVLYVLGIIKNDKNSLIARCVVCGIHVALFIYIVIVGSTDSAFISAVSPIMPLERLCSMPMEIILHFVIISMVIGNQIAKNIIDMKKGVSNE